MRIFLTGATGVIGRRALPLLIGAGHSVTAVVRRPQSHAELVRAGATPIEVDLFAADAVRKTVAGHDAVVNLATHMPAGYRAFLPGAWAENDRIRRFASANLVDAAMATGATRLIQESFAPVYPDRGDQWIDERTPIAPVRYNRTVADAERSAERFSGSGGAGVVLRFAMFYGPDSWFTRDLIGYVRRGWAPIPGVATPIPLWSRTRTPPPRSSRRWVFRPAPTTWSMTSRCAAASSSIRLPGCLASRRRDCRRHG